jgi:hypothetical protein
MCVKVGKVKRENLYEMTRKYWKVDINRARKATHVLAIVNSIVEEVYNPVDWKYTEDPKHLGRCEFHGSGRMNVLLTLVKSVTCLLWQRARIQ